MSFSWNFGDGSAAGTGDAPTHVYATSGAFIVTLTVTDGRGGESAASTTVAIGAAGDRAPPSVSLLGPREVLPGDQVTITAQATDNIKVDKVTFQVDGANPSESLTQPFQRSITVPSVAAPGTEILVTATATDPSGNTGSAEATLTIKARPDTEKPTVTLNAPPLTAPGSPPSHRVRPGQRRRAVCRVCRQRRIARHTLAAARTKRPTRSRRTPR